MIERIQIRNFQRHRKLRVVFDQRITTIVGPSDTGKSAILRAIRWVAFNRPLGTGFIYHGEDTCAVKLWVDGHTVERRKSPDGNVYLLDGRRLAAVGTDVPQDVQDVLRLTPENFQGQHDSPFWFSLTPGEVAKRLNVIVDLEVIDRSASWLSSQLRRARTELDVVTDRLSAAKEKAQRLSFVPTLVKEFQALDTQREKLERAQGTRDSLRDAVEGLRTVAQTRLVLRSIQDEGSEAGAAAEALQAAYEAQTSLRETIEKTREARTTLDQLKQDVVTARQELQDKVGGVCPICGGKMK